MVSSGRLTRLPDWRARFAAEMDRQRCLPFAWGRQDCVIGLACGAVEAITGADLAVGWRSKYKSPKSALKALRAKGYDGVADLVAGHLPEIEPALARIGDLALITDDGPLGHAIGIVDASGLIVITETGHGRAPRDRMTRAFQVG
ncbi:hypothetical protein RGQ15_11625 [Paracoccus sp. MBLB3053]|uniref:DUF6950 domain-containing protein n=1 Tax=Paracoccus aurantius TaxID=3073814 RepID=A0ABU2HT49_9RHOB|nr:hypothetical protein [Paracoccus sp. MBLB3053]MDS9468216.1 hypothetical protein [Paracoccus sp. MBLB3053]